MSQTNRIAPLILSSVDASEIGLDTWTPFEVDGVPVSGLIAPVFMIRITNRCGNIVYISFNGEDRHQEIIGWDSINLYFQENSSPSNYVSKVAAGTKFYVQGWPDLKGGNIFLAGYYNKIL